jgi:hypothetical protein
VAAAAQQPATLTATVTGARVLALCMTEGEHSSSTVRSSNSAWCRGLLAPRMCEAARHMGGEGGSSSTVNCYKAELVGAEAGAELLVLHVCSKLHDTWEVEGAATLQAAATVMEVAEGSSRAATSSIDSNSAWCGGLLASRVREAARRLGGGQQHCAGEAID